MCRIFHKLSMPEQKSLSIEMVQTLKKYGEFAPWLESGSSHARVCKQIMMRKL